MDGRDRGGRTVLNFRTFLKKAGIERSKHLRAEVAVGLDAVEDENGAIVEEMEDRATDQRTPLQRTSLH